jgi:hypothetical protein
MRSRRWRRRSLAGRGVAYQLLQEGVGALGHAKVVGARPRLDLGLGRLGPLDDQLEQVGVEAGEQRDDVQPVGERAAVGQVALDLLAAIRLTATGWMMIGRQPLTGPASLVVAERQYAAKLAR